MRRLAFFLTALVVLLSSGCASRPAEGNLPPPRESLYVPDPPLEERANEPRKGESEEPPVEPLPLELPEGAEEFVRAADYIPGLLVELRYATENNFTGQVIYGFSDAYLRWGTVEKLACVQSLLAEEGLGLKIWDAFRPPSAQFRLWEICPDSRYVADPTKGFSSHSRGNTVDLTLVDGEGNELEMPTGFDDFSAKADRDYSDVSLQAAENALRLEAAMTAGGFQPYSGEWWHFSDKDRYDVEEDFQPPEDETGGDSHG